jgi:hypothetical protein
MVMSQSNQGNLEDIEVVIRKDKDITLPRANRNYQKISEIPQPEIKPSGELSFGDHNIGLSPLDPSIRINKLKDEPLSKLYGNYVRGGFGNYANTYLEAFVGNKREDKGYFNIHGLHNAYGNGPVDNSGNSRNRIKLNGGLFYDDFTLDADAYYDRQGYNFYGFPSDSVRSIREDSTGVVQENVYNRFGIGFGVSKNDPLDYLNFDLNFDIDYISDELEQSEIWMGAGFKGNYDLNVGRSILFDARYLYAGYALDTFSNSRHLFEFAPRYQMEEDNFRVSGGLRVSFESDTNLKGDVHFYPVGLFEYFLADRKVIPYAGIDGGLQANGFNTFTEENPFLANGNLLSHSNKKIEIFGGLKTSIINNTWIDARVSYSTVDNLPLMINTAFDESKFQILYARNASVLNVSLGGTADVNQKLKLGLNLNYWNYGFSDTTEAWHLPQFQAHVYGKYAISDKIYMNVDIFSINGIFAYTSMERKKALDPILDLNFGAEYRFSDRFSAFLQFRNILSNNYQRYLHYENRGLQVRAGLTYTF